MVEQEPRLNRASSERRADEFRKSDRMNPVGELIKFSVRQSSRFFNQSPSRTFENSRQNSIKVTRLDTGDETPEKQASKA